MMQITTLMHPFNTFVYEGYEGNEIVGVIEKRFIWFAMDLRKTLLLVINNIIIYYRRYNNTN